jgi:EAL and modified HD-GYP domain-containing signal transduction protein
MHMKNEAPGTGPAAENFVFARQPIVGRDQKLVAYELLFRSMHHTAGAGQIDDAAATAAVIAHASQLGLENVVGKLLAFINVDAVCLNSDFITFLPVKKVMLEILETVVPTPALLERIKELKRLGYQLALDDVVGQGADVQQLVPLVDVVKIDVMATPAQELKQLVASLRKPGRKLLAEKVESAEDFARYHAMGFDYFQGYYFARPAHISGRKISPNEMAVISLLDLVQTDASQSELESSVKRDPMISLNLLRLVNTPAAGTVSQISSIGQALTILGRRQLQRWLQILMYASAEGALDLNSPLLQLATTRGKLMELMTREAFPRDAARADTAFTVGVLSLIDTLFGMPMAEVMDVLAASDDVREALLERSGPFGELLVLVDMLEREETETARLEQLLDQLDLSPARLGQLQMSAFKWVSGLA